MNHHLNQFRQQENKQIKNYLRFTWSQDLICERGGRDSIRLLSLEGGERRGGGCRTGLLNYPKPKTSTPQHQLKTQTPNPKPQTPTPKPPKNEP